MPTTRASSKMAKTQADDKPNTSTVSQPNNPAATMSRKHQANMVQVPTDVLSNLLTSIDSLRQEVTRLRSDVGKAVTTGNNEVMKQLQVDMSRLAKGQAKLLKSHRDLKNEIKHLNENVRDLERHSGIANGFTCFDQLPLELRIYIRQLALCEPELFALEQTFEHVWGGDDAYVHDGYAPKWLTRKSQIMWVNQEARKEAQRLLKECESTSHGGFLNYDVDTVWVPHVYQTGEVYYNLVWKTLSGTVKSLAIHYELWEEDIANVRHISDYGDLVELVLVIGTEEGVSQPVMITPTKPPSYYAHRGFHNLEGTSWGAVAEKVVKQIQEVKQERNALREHLINDHGLDEEELENDHITWKLWGTVPAVRFVQLVSESHLEQIRAKGAAGGGVCHSTT